MDDIQYIVTHDGGRWWNLPYVVSIPGYDSYIGAAATLRGAKRIIRADRRKRARGKRVVYKTV